MKSTIVDSVCSILGSVGVEGLTMDRVAQEAGVAKGTLYAYFEDKAHLLESVVEATIQPLSDDIKRILADDRAPEDKIRELVYHHLSFFDEHGDMFRVLLYERHKIQGKWQRYRSSRYRMLLERIAKVIEDGIAVGRFRTVDPVKAAAILFDANVSIINQRLFNRCNVPVAEDVELILQIFLGGISQPLQQNRKEAP